MYYRGAVSWYIVMDAHSLLVFFSYNLFRFQLPII